MAQFTISAYNSDGRCKICWSLASEKHHEGCELGAVYAERKEMRLVIEQFLKLLGVATITSAFAKIAAEQQRALDGGWSCAFCGLHNHASVVKRCCWCKTRRK